eukprot:TRINITY_DN11484_c0_g1_i1.p1 TRINITY_DN11484_c0_g1~~TRINITY_DN11484_c0_g1_i1.p1  ORF type:complete len:604 (-),score=119.35 TRINITY_DN11484_c0_g1_i1:274-2064(-)
MVLSACCNPSWCIPDDDDFESPQPIGFAARPSQKPPEPHDTVSNQPAFPPFGWPSWDLKFQSKLWMQSLPDAKGNGLKSNCDEFISLHKKYPFFALPHHYLHKTSKEVSELLCKGDKKASAALERLTNAIQLEEETVESLHEMFSTRLFELREPDRSNMRSQDAAFMLQFFGIPFDRKNLLDFMDAIDTDHDRKVNLAEFRVFVGRLGGSLELFESRKAPGRRGFARRDALLDSGELMQDAAKLSETVASQLGMKSSAQHFWRLVASSSELRELAALKPCQMNALKVVRFVAKENHEKALPKLQDRMKKLGYNGKEMEITLAWIREVPPIIIQIDLNRFSSYLMNDTHYRNQFETKTSSAYLNTVERKQWESSLFQGAYDGTEVEGFDRCKYGCLNVMSDYRGVAGTEFYGNSYLILKDVRLRCTFTPQDSGNCPTIDKVAVIDFFAHQLLEYTNAELMEVVRIANNTETLVGSSTMIKGLRYKEAQIHGEISFAKHVDRLCASDEHNTSYWPVHLQEICTKYGWKFSWIADEKVRIEREEAWQRLGALFWKERLQIKPTDGELEELFKSKKKRASKIVKKQVKRPSKIVHAAKGT